MKDETMTFKVINDEGKEVECEVLFTFESDETKKNYIEELSIAGKELERLSGWGGFNPDDFSYLANKGIYLLPFETSPENYKKIPFQEFL